MPCHKRYYGQVWWAMKSHWQTECQTPRVTSLAPSVIILLGDIRKGSQEDHHKASGQHLPLWSPTGPTSRPVSNNKPLRTSHIYTTAMPVAGTGPGGESQCLSEKNTGRTHNYFITTCVQQPECSRTEGWRKKGVDFTEVGFTCKS